MDETQQRLLLVVDDAKEALVLAQDLAQAGIHVVVCHEVCAAQSLLERFSFRALITDLSFPPLYGFEGIRLIAQARAQYPHLRIIGLSQKAKDPASKMFAELNGYLIYEKAAHLSGLALQIREDMNLHAALGHIDRLGTLDDFLAQKSLRALLQPIVRLKDSSIVIYGVESLARANFDRKLWNAELLFDYADRKNRTFEADLHCLKAAFEEVSQVDRNLHFFMNVRPSTVVEPQFLQVLLRLCHRSRVDPCQVVLELTEQQMITNLPLFNKAMSGIRAYGIQIALDDFGQGYANLQLVDELKPDIIKISGVFCRGIDQDRSKQELVRAVASMARNLGMKTVLESVETSEEAAAAIELGIDFGQGYFFSKPIKAQELLSWRDSFAQPVFTQPNIELS